jgi:ABC-type thiamin/hydroxymethylpyrimidine transport system permease subunit
MNFYDNFINCLDKKLKLNRLLSVIFGMIFILGNCYLTRDLNTHSVKNTPLCWTMWPIGVVIGILLMALGFYDKNWKKK